jgi:hypothetical protein
LKFNCAVDLEVFCTHMSKVKAPGTGCTKSFTCADPVGAASVSGSPHTRPFGGSTASGPLCSVCGLGDGGAAPPAPPCISKAVVSCDVFFTQMRQKAKPGRGRLHQLAVYVSYVCEDCLLGAAGVFDFIFGSPFSLEADVSYRTKPHRPLLPILVACRSEFVSIQRTAPCLSNSNDFTAAGH